MRITVTPAGATRSLEACSWVEPILPFMLGGNPRSALSDMRCPLDGVELAARAL
jgi:hypothetical protein